MDSWLPPPSLKTWWIARRLSPLLDPPLGNHPLQLEQSRLERFRGLAKNDTHKAREAQFRDAFVTLWIGSLVHEAQIRDNFVTFGIGSLVHEAQIRDTFVTLGSGLSCPRCLFIYFEPSRRWRNGPSPIKGPWP